MSSPWFGPEYADDEDDVIDIDRQDKEEDEKVEPPRPYHVFILNDDYSTFELVIEVCMQFFGQTEDRAQRTAMDVHTKGRGLAGTYAKDIAETKVAVMNDFAQQREMPLKAIAEPGE